MQEPLHAPQEELLRPSRLLIEGIIGHIENSHGNATQNIGFRTKNVELNPGSWSCVVTLDEVSITVEYGQNAESKKWNISIGVSKGLDPLLALCAMDQEIFTFETLNTVLQAILKVNGRGL